MKAAYHYANAVEAVGFALRTIRPSLLFREIQAVKEFYTPGRLLSVLVDHFPDDLKGEWAQRRFANRAYQGSIDQRIYNWIQTNAHLHADQLYSHYLDYKDQV